MVRKNILGLFVLSIIFTLTACSNQDTTKETLPQEWSEIVEKAKGQKVTMMMWQGDPLINDYMESYVKPHMKDSFGIELQLANGQGNQIVQALIAERQAGISTSQLDMIWINGETFYQLRELEALFGPWIHQLPNYDLLDLQNPFIGQDFQQDINGYECPWGNVQMTWIYHSHLVKDPPQSRTELKAYVKEHPGLFTWDVHFTGMTLLKAWIIDIAGQDDLSGEFDERKYEKYSEKLWAFIDSLRPYLWREGESFPNSVAQMHQLFVEEEVLFTFSNNDAEVDNKIARSIFDTTARAFVPDYGSIQNSHYLGIPSGSASKEAAMVLANFLISPEAQLRKLNPKVWGDGTVLNVDSLPPDLMIQFQNAQKRKNAPSRNEIQVLALQELAPEYMIRLYKDFQKYIEQ